MKGVFFYIELIDRVLKEYAYLNLTVNTKSKLSYYDHSQLILNFNSPSLYDDEKTMKIKTWQLLHELGHAIMEHKTYNDDLELIDLEVEAWVIAEGIAKKNKFKISRNYIEGCLDSYREYLFTRSWCKRCEMCGYQTGPDIYFCMNCQSRWKVNDNKLKRIKKTKWQAT
jgi:hypothetical protein